MKIRNANKFDTQYIIDMLKHFRAQTPLDIMNNCTNEIYVSKILQHIFVGGGIALLAETDKPIGLICGVIDANIWNPDMLVLRELCYWVEPEHRNTTAGYRLLREYNRQADLLVQDNRIALYTMTKMANSPDLDFSRFGYKKTEEIWVAGA